MTVKRTLRNVREMINAKHGIYYQYALDGAVENDIPVKKPRVCTIQVNRENYDTDSISDYYKVSLTIPFLDNLIESMNDRFAPKSTACCIFWVSYSAWSVVEK